MFAFIYLMYTLFPEKFKKIHTYIILILFSLALVNSYQAIRFRFKYCRTIIYGPNNEKIYSTQEKALPLIEFLDWSDNNTNPEDNILVYPEGPIVNILAKRKTNLMLYSLHSIFMDTFGPKNVIKAIGENNIEYIVYVTGKSVFPFANNNYYPEFEEYLNKNYRAIIKFPKSNVPAADSYTVYKLIK